MFPIVPMWLKKNLCVLIVLLGASYGVKAQPANDNCVNAIPVTIGTGGFALGTFNSTQVNIGAATLQTGETFAPGILSAGVGKKSVWYKFTLPTTRGVEVFLKQPAVAIADGNVGFAVYKTSNCLPGDAQISTKLTPIAKFASSKHPCLDAGEYYVQVSANDAANGLVFISVEVAEPDPAPYDKPINAHKLGDLTDWQQKFTDVNISCQSIDDAAEVCLPNSSFKDYSKSMWYTFKTPAYLDYLNTWMAVTNLPYGTPTVKVGYRLYEGDATTTLVKDLIQKGGCDSMLTDLYVLARKSYSCGDLKPNTTYTVQLLFHKDFNQTIRFGTDWNGKKKTNGPLPVTTLAAPNKMGTLVANSASNGATNTIEDVFGCNSRHSQNNCPKSMPAQGVLHQGLRFNLSSFVSFSLASTSSIFINSNKLPCNGQLLLRLYKQGLPANCADLDTSKIIATFNYNTYASNPISCLDAGDYVLQVMAVDSLKGYNNMHYGSLASYLSNLLCMNPGLGSTYNLFINVRTEVAINKFSLNAPGRFDKLNANGVGVMLPLQPYTTYKAQTDTFGCANTVLPEGPECLDGNNQVQGLTKASYREFVLTDSSMLFVNMHNTLNTRLFKGDANALATNQNKRNYPDKIAGLEPFSKCLFPYNYGYGFSNTCAVPGTYTMVSFDNRQNASSNLEITPRITRTKHGTPATAQDMGDLWSYVQPNSWHRSDLDTFTCYDNPATIDGILPCNGSNGIASTKLIYRQFYLSRPTFITIVNFLGAGSVYGAGRYNLFKGKATDGITGLKKMGAPWECFVTANPLTYCDELPAGWYTLVSYGSGPSFSEPLANMPSNYQYSDLGAENCFYISLRKPCDEPQFNRPFKASVDTTTKKPYLIEYKPQPGHNAAYPKTGTTYTLNRENFDCRQDTSFIRQFMTNCNADNVKVAFYVFTTTQESYIQIDGIADGLWSRLYAFDVRTKDSVKLKTDTSFQPCLNRKGKMEFCKLQPGTYTMVFYTTANYYCNAVTPTIYIDQVGTSRFDHAANAYDFGVLKSDSVWYNGKQGDVNPLNAGRAPSNDFFYCTTGAQEKDPDAAICYTRYNPNIYPDRKNAVQNPVSVSYNSRRNLWYTFVVNEAGNVKIRVDNKTPGKGLQNVFSVFKSDVDPAIPWNTMRNNGLIDSTLLQGLQMVGTNFISNSYYCTGPSYFPNNLVSVDVSPCDFKPTRYYVLVDTRGIDRDPWYQGEDMIPNYQIEVSALHDATTAKLPKFDHFSQAGDMGLINSGKKRSDSDNFTCATRDLPDPLYAYTNCQKTLWYKFSTNTTGKIRYAVFHKGGFKYYYDDIQLFRQIKANDSSSNGLQHLPVSVRIDKPDGFWGEQCITPGTYYIILPGCNAKDEDVFVEVEIIPQAGDFCSAPMIAAINGIGSKVVPVTVDCHTIGTDYGEFNNTLTCPANAPTANYKTSWYRLDITGKDTLDLTVYIDEKTNAGSTDIKYRMMTGSCGAMQEQSCVQDALTRNTYECMVPGVSYYIQVFTPITINNQPVNGTIDLNISAVKHIGACAPANNCIAVAEFLPKFDCTKDRNMTVTNLSTFGSDITYEWDFGYNNQKSNAVSPEFFYPALTTDKTYTVKLTVTNTVCGKTATISKTINIPARPAVNLGRDTIFCTNGSSLLLNATSHSGSTYYWNYGFTQPTVTASSNGNWIVEVTYNNCKARDTINIWINPIAKRAMVTQALCNTDQVNLNAARGQGEVYRWNTGAATASITASQQGYYWCDLFLNGCTIRDSFYVINPSGAQQNKTITVCQKDMPYQADATVSGASSYKWNDNNTNAKRNIATPGIWWVDVSISGCTIRDSLTIKVDSFKNVTTNARICFGQNYRLPSGKNVNTSGTYRDTLRNVRGCDSLITRVNLTVESPTTTTLSGFIYTGQTYVLPWGRSVSVAGVFRDTTKSTIGCDSVITVVNLQMLTVQTQITEISICPGSNYTLPWGGSVGAAGAYADTIKSSTGADSLMKIVNLSVIPKSIITGDTTVCHGSSFTLRANNALTYKWSPGNDLSALDIRNPVFTANQTRRYTLEATYEVNGNSITCTDSVRIQVVTKTITNLSANICVGQSYTLPSGKQVNTTGMYMDTIRSVIGCDSLITNVNLTVQASTTKTLNAFICQGQNYTLPSGRMINASGMYRDTLRYASGCDSVITVVNLTRNDVTVNTSAITICPGDSYTLPSGRNINASGIYRDTLRYATGCDSLRTTINLSVKDATVQNFSATICAGQTYTLPAGKVVNTTGLYADTLRNASGCDSLITNINLTVQNAVSKIISDIICQGQNYTLPSGRMVNATGMYRDTLRYASGCDSAITVVNLTRYDVTTTALSATICLGNTYTLPSGKMINSSGTYRDTLRYANGCDSIRYTITLAVSDAQRNASTAYICAGSSFRLPSGRMVSTAGLYRDTMRIAQNCDSLISNITLIVDAVTVQTLTPKICQGNTYTFPSGRIVSAAGNYRDTLRNIRGCDSIRFTINITVDATRFGTASATLCAGQAYTLPSGSMVTRAGTYSDTIQSSVTGCDSVVTVTLTYREPLRVVLSGPSSVCTGVSATLTATASGGTGGPYTYTWTGASGSSNTLTVSPTATTKYVVTVSDGCSVLPARDSLTITYVPPPQPGLNNTTVVICRGSSTQLTATGGATYAWSPAIGLSNTAIANPVASPLVDTRYRVVVTTATGCVGEDSILVRVTQPFTLTASLDTFVCAGASVPLFATGAQQYEWTGTGISATTGSNVNARPSVTTTYTVTGYGPDNCFTQTRNIRVTVIALPTVNAGRDTTIMVGTGFILRPTYTGSNLQYRWTPGQYLSCADCANPTVTPKEPMEYAINVRNAFGCESNDRIRIELLCNGESVFLPNTFTPNGDGVNDIWYPRGGGIRQVKSLKVFNRWGQAIFERINFNTDDRTAGWDGTYKGQPLPPDVFVFTMAVTCDNGQTLETKGNVMIVR